jgi:hypothetical protein
MTIAEVASAIILACVAFSFGFDLRDRIKAKDKNVLYNLELTEEELEFVYMRCSRKAERMEEANLKDTPCYRLSWQVMNKISKIRKDKEDTHGT